MTLILEMANDISTHNIAIMVDFYKNMKKQEKNNK